MGTEAGTVLLGFFCSVGTLSKVKEDPHHITTLTPIKGNFQKLPVATETNEQEAAEGHDSAWPGMGARWALGQTQCTEQTSRGPRPPASGPLPREVPPWAAADTSPHSGRQKGAGTACSSVSPKAAVGTREPLDFRFAVTS